jgi:hypothetical protein
MKKGVIIDCLDEVKVDAPDQPGKGQVIAFTVWGILRGLETFRQENSNHSCFLFGRLLFLSLRANIYFLHL